MQNGTPQTDYDALAARIKAWGKALGFQAVGISDTHLDAAEAHLLQWLVDGHHGAMDYMAKHGVKRARPAELVPGTMRVISVRMNYYPEQARDTHDVIADGSRAFISRYALGRDYHKVLRNRLEKLAQLIRDTADCQCRVFTDSAPVLEVELAQKAHLGWRGKHTLLLSRERGSWFFLGEIYIDLPLPVESASGSIRSPFALSAARSAVYRRDDRGTLTANGNGGNHCGTCHACINVCPTQAITAPYRLDARRCISYLTIELRDSIPPELRPLIGNRIYGCDDCQLVCPWNSFAQKTVEPDFAVRHGLDDISLIELFAWDEAAFNSKLSGSAIYRIGHEQWLRNIAVALGNAPAAPQVVQALQTRAQHPSSLVREHVAWALLRHSGS
jgi:epoxyqueuosine reductase